MKFEDAMTRSGVLRGLLLKLGKSLGRDLVRMCMMTMMTMVMATVMEQMTLNHP